MVAAIGKVLALTAGSVALLTAATPVWSDDVVVSTSSAASPVRTAEAAADSARIAYRAPVPGPVTRLFDAPLFRWSSGHRGVDLAATPGQTVHSPGDGRVVFAGTVVDRGVVTVLHPDGLRTSLEPVDPGVEVGDEVHAGDVLGTLQTRSGHDGVHWGVRDGDTYLNPLDLLGRTAPVVLLPPGG
ncbi:peptidoglycan DD-metalloendopeptidase family protein [Actinotalea sp. M2MS4P-6]|uniref:murein hydrolase activator EnvC family protein n=1 Tax=Actinotalea sp. M2MS4P-6 TaxID=2983762 RepID=UPI0021E368F1|nr:M23 family metallopeptidase [Actinotalea sp. M2MS4P-6]MCV2396098.1 peptidoglycan DD-metalloendopeptidase family protein [Actinotalea sp. M2MS4P-6]